MTDIIPSIMFILFWVVDNREGGRGHGGNIHTVGMILRPGVYVCVGYLVQHVAKFVIPN